MKLSVSAFRAQASAQRKILTSYQNQLNYGACTSFPALGGFKLDEKSQMLVESTGIGIGPPASRTPNDRSPNTSQEDPDDRRQVPEDEKEKAAETAAPGDRTTQGQRDEGADKSPARTRTKSNQRWMKLRTTVQLSGAITSTTQKSKPALKREDSFLKRFSTRQIPETQETVDTGDDTETANGPHTHNEVTRRRRKRRKELSKTVVNPDENFYFYWLMTVTVCVLYNLWTLIVRQSFPELQRGASELWYAGDGFTDVIFVCDIVVQFRTGYLEQGLMVYDSKKLATHYLKSRAFILDMLSLLPLDFLQWNLGVNPILRFPRFLKIYRIYSYYYMVESRTVYPNLWRVVNLIHILLILAHWFGCFYYLLSEAEGFQGDWVYPYRPGDYATLTRKYLGSLYWSTLTLTTIGDLPTPETNAESRGGNKAMTSPSDPHSIPRRGHKSRLLQFNSNYGYLFTIISYLIGVFIFATIVGQVGNVITNRNANRLEFERLLDGAKTYMRHHKVPGGMKRRVLRWYDYSWSRGRIQGGGDINTALGLLPDKLKTELALHVNLSVLKKVTIFQECQPEFLHDLVLKMKAYIFTPGDLICRKGEVAREMFIIADGILDVISETGRVLTTMKAGDFFGEIGILNLDGLNKRTADVRSVGYSELFSLSREDVLTAMKDYPEAQEILQNLGRKRLMEAKNAIKMHKVQSKQNKDLDSSGDSDNAGKRIVEKLRSDVKGLKNALRRSRRGARAKEGFDGYTDSGTGRTQAKKQSILRRMSHVQSSDEFEGSSEVVQSPIGAGLPLLQRLKCLKEKQEREKEEKSRTKANVQSVNEKDDDPEVEPTAANLLPPQMLKSFQETREPFSTPSGSTVRTQQTGLNNYLVKSNTTTSLRDEEENSVEKKASVTEEKRVPLIEKIRFGVRERKNVEEAELSPPSEVHTETSSNVPAAVAVFPAEGTSEANISVPKISLINKFKVPKSRDGWKLLKKSSITGSRVKRNPKTFETNPIKRVTKRGTYLSKSDTVLERQKTLEKEDKRSRSISPLEKLNFPPRVTDGTNGAEGDHRGKAKTEAGLAREPAWKSSGRLFETRHTEDISAFMKKYDSISDLSPEYSGLPFVKKLKILNERQKLAELEKELVVRSASLDVPDRETRKCAGVLTRSQSEASTIEMRSKKSLMRSTTAEEEDDSFSTAETRTLRLPGKGQSEDSIASPESNETIERRHLKSILKKLSADGSTSDEETTSKAKKRDRAEMRKLMRAPTVEGYAARHRKLTKSVTFDSETLSSPPEFVATSPEIGTKTNEESNKAAGRMTPRFFKTDDAEGAVPKILRTIQEELDEWRERDPAKRHQVMLDPNGEGAKPSTSSSDGEHFGELLRIINGHVRRALTEVEDQHQVERRNLEEDIRRRDEVIKHLLGKLNKLEEGNFSIVLGELSGEDCEKGAGKVVGNYVSWANPNAADEDQREYDYFALTTDKTCNFKGSSQHLRNRPQKSLDVISDDDLELSDMSGKWKANDAKAMGNANVGDTKLESGFRHLGHRGGDGENQNRGRRAVDRIIESHRPFTCMHEKEFLALDIDDGSASSDVEEPNNKDWEIQMLVKEMEKNESTNAGSDPEAYREAWVGSESRASATEHLDDVRKLQAEVDTLKQVVCEGDLTRLSSSELDMLETIIEAKDRKISQIDRSNSLDQSMPDNVSGQRQRYSRSCTSESDNRDPVLRKRSTFQKKLGQALSFDFHDIGTRKFKSEEPTTMRQKLTVMRKPKPDSCKQERKNLWHRSGHSKSQTVEGAKKTNARNAGSSLPALVSGFLNHEKTSDTRLSMPSLSGQESHLVHRLSTSVSSSQDTLKEDDFGESCDSVFEMSEEGGHPAKIGSISWDLEGSSVNVSGINSFIKSMGQKVMQAVSGDVGAIKNQVPTISELCDQHLPGKDVAEGLDEASKLLENPVTGDGDEEHHHSHLKTEPPDL